MQDYNSKAEYKLQNRQEIVLFSKLKPFNAIIKKKLSNNEYYIEAKILKTYKSGPF